MKRSERTTVTVGQQKEKERAKHEARMYALQVLEEREDEQLMRRAQ